MGTRSFTAALSAVLDNRGQELSGTERHVLSVLAWHCDDDTGVTEVEAPLLVEQTGLERETIYRTVKALESKGRLLVTRRAGLASILQVLTGEPKSPVSEDHHREAPLVAARTPLGGPRAAPPLPPKAAPLAVSRHTTVSRSPQEADYWSVFDVLCGPIAANASVAWQTKRLLACRTCIEKGISADDLRGAASNVGLQPGYGAGEQALIDLVLQGRGEKPQQWGRPVFVRPDTAQKVSQGVAAYLEMKRAASN